MPDKSTIEKARKDKAQGKSASTQAGEFVHDEIEKVRKGKHGVRSVKQAIAIGLSEARRSGVKLPPPKNGSAALKKKARQDEEKAKSNEPVSQKRSRARIKALKKDPLIQFLPKHFPNRQHLQQEKKCFKRSAAAKKAAKTRAKNKSK
jgi:hypothetical protein